MPDERLDRIRPARPGERWLIIRRILREGLDPTRVDYRRFVIAESATGEVLGMAQLKVLGSSVVEFGSLIVEPEARGRGIGGALLQHLVEPAPKPVYLLCGEQMVEYYGRFGFRTVENSNELPDPLQKKWRIGSFFARLFNKRVAVMVRKV